MAKASEHQSSSVTKLLFIGDGGTRKTTALCSLLAAGYKIRVYDLDNLLSPLISAARLRCPDKLDNLEFMTFSDKMRASPQGPIIDGVPTAFVGALKALDKWDDGTVPAQWGPDTIAVIDSGTRLARAAHWWAKGLQGAATFAEGVPVKGVEGRSIIRTAQQALMNVIAQLTADSFSCNVIWIAHIRYQELDGKTKGFPQTVGTAIGPEIPTYFPTIALAEKKGDGDNAKYVIRTQSTNLINLKNSKFDILPELPNETGLAEIFRR